MRVIVIGGGAAGFFGAIAAAEAGHEVTILEATSTVLAKVRVSGGGRCNVTHNCFEPRRLSESYPRGGKALRGTFSRFQPQDTIEWFAKRGVELKTEADGRMFPTTDDSATIIDCFTRHAKQTGVVVRTKSSVAKIVKSADRFDLLLGSGETVEADRVLLATGGNRAGFELARQLGHSIVSPVPSLFTFKVSDPRITDLPGVAVDPAECQLQIGKAKSKQSGPVLITHWGFSGPAVLKLSAWEARALYEVNYQAILRINWLPAVKESGVRETLQATKKDHAKKTVESFCPWPLPKRLWKSLVTHAAGAQPVRWAELSKAATNRLVQELSAGEYQVAGKGVFKDEFVTCGGLDLKEVDFRTMESRVCPGLFFAGEVLDVDGITGGFNFQNAWSTAWIAGNSLC